METLDDGYYWATQKDLGNREIIEIFEGYVYIMGSDRVSTIDKFENFQNVPDEER